MRRNSPLRERPHCGTIRPCAVDRASSASAVWIRLISRRGRGRRVAHRTAFSDAGLIGINCLTKGDVSHGNGGIGPGEREASGQGLHLHRDLRASALHRVLRVRDDSRYEREHVLVHARHRAIPGGIVWMYLAARVPKPGATIAMSVIVAVVGLLLGMLWTGPVGIVVGGVLAEIIMTADSRALRGHRGVRSVDVVLLARAGVDGVSRGRFLRRHGGSIGHEPRVRRDARRVHAEPPSSSWRGVLCVVGPIVGGLLGSKIFNKHFARIAA